MKTLFVALILCLSGPVFGQVTTAEVKKSAIGDSIWDDQIDTVSSWSFRPSYVLERVVIDTVAKCDTVFVPESVMGTLDDWETVTYCRVEIHCKKVPRERVLWSVAVDGDIDISGLTGLRVREVPNPWLSMIRENAISVYGDSLRVEEIQ